MSATAEMNANPNSRSQKRHSEQVHVLQTNNMFWVDGKWLMGFESIQIFTEINFRCDFIFNMWRNTCVIGPSRIVKSHHTESAWENESGERVIHRYVFKLDIDSLSVCQLWPHPAHFAHIHKHVECEFNSIRISLTPYDWLHFYWKQMECVKFMSFDECFIYSSYQRSAWAHTYGCRCTKMWSCICLV